MSTFVGWPGVFTLQKTSYSVWRLITEKEPNFSAYYLFFLLVFFFKFKHQSCPALTAEMVPTPLDIAQMEPKTGTA